MNKFIKCSSIIEKSISCGIYKGVKFRVYVLGRGWREEG